MTDTPNENNQAPKKVSLAEAIRNKLAQQKQAQHDNKHQSHQNQGGKTLKSQMTKKVNNQRRRTGGS